MYFLQSISRDGCLYQVSFSVSSPHLVEYKCIDNVTCSGNTYNTYTHNTLTNPWGLKPHQNRHFWGEIQAREREREHKAKDKEGKINKVQSLQPEHSFTEKENKDERVSTVFIYHSQPNQWTQTHLQNNQTFISRNIWVLMFEPGWQNISWKHRKWAINEGWYSSFCSGDNVHSIWPSQWQLA